MRGLSYDEVAASLEVSTSAVESLLFRARRGLQPRLREAAAAVSTAGWAGYLGDLASRLLGGGAAAPAAAKVVAVGLGSAVVAGGAIVAAPHEIGAGHAIGPVPGHTRPRPPTSARRRTASDSARVAARLRVAAGGARSSPEPTVLDRTASSPSGTARVTRGAGASRPHGVPTREREQEQPVATIRQSTRPLARPGSGTSDDQPTSVVQAPETSTAAPPATPQAAARAEGGDAGAGERGVTSTSSDRADGSGPTTTDPTPPADPGTSRASERDD